MAGRVVWRWVRVCVVLHEDLWDRELRDGGHAAGALGLEVPPEVARPVDGVEEADDDVAPDGFFDALESGATTEEFFESV